eukprot:CAMPEP_0172521694 /NCGR_PEP_ID=MMETSP1066-20121228/292723_1 /TAXON_ID=671091 /ORGANISM="Coscinodiscus wailesii, Strain CCMP2513" /LENGTH=1168 /DNA_ID=CAMNT_0013304643 /DNA_START=136 /DNA_END=3642 /DNA_ORIENTATION=+
MRLSTVSIPVLFAAVPSNGIIRVSDATINIDAEEQKRLLQAPSPSLLEEILLTDIFGDELLDDPNCVCNPSSASGTFDYTFTLSPPYFDDQYIPQEQLLFLAQMEHIDDDPSKSWKIRIGTGGNIYSYVGPLGETMPPNRKAENYMVDEVWQNVAVNSALNNGEHGPYFIHQAGIYQKDSPRSDMPYFFSPNVVHWCDGAGRECRFASWGQHAHVPTKYVSKALYINRYRDCGDGVLEATTGIHNFDNNMASDVADYVIENDTPVRFNYMSFPWFGVNNKVYRDVLISDSTSDEYITKWPNPFFGADPLKELRTTKGYSMFAEFRRERSEFVLPGTIVDPAAVQPDFIMGVVGQRNGQDVSCLPFKFHSVNYQTYMLRCRLDTTIKYTKPCRGCDLTLTNTRTQQSIDVINVEHWSWYNSGLDMYELYIAPKSGQVSNRFTWTTYDATFAEEVAAGVNAVLAVGDEFVVSWTDSGIEDDENHVLAFVHGNDPEITYAQNGELEQYWGGWAKLHYGDANSFERKFMVFNEVQYIWMDPGATFGRKQYIITGKNISDAGLTAQSWVNEAIQDFSQIGDLPSTQIDVVMNQAGTHYGVALGGNECTGSAVCTGSSTPRYDPVKKFTIPHFEIICGNQVYFGPDLYHFAPYDTTTEYQYSYVCDESDYTIRPQIRLIGYFPDGDCSAFESLSFDDSYCSSEVTPSDVPSLSPHSLCPVSSPTSSPTSLLTEKQSPNPSSLPSIEHSTYPSPKPTLTSSLLPTIVHSTSPSASSSFLPSKVHSEQPSLTPTNVHSTSPTSSFSIVPSAEHSTGPSFNPTATPSFTPSKQHSIGPTSSVSSIPSVKETSNPTSMLSATPTKQHSSGPTSSLSRVPSVKETSNPTLTTGCNPGEQPITITIKTDRFPDETTWILENICTDTIELNGGPYEKKNRVYETTECIPAGQEYHFIIVDAYADGICCDHGRGYYGVLFDGETYSGGDFFHEDSHTFGFCDGTDFDTPTPTPYNSPNWKLIFSNDFEKPNMWGNFRSGGKYAKHVTDEDYAWSGEASIMIQHGQRKKSLMISDEIDVSEYAELEVRFMFMSTKMRGRGFSLDYKTDMSARWITHGEWLKNVDIVENEWQEIVEHIPIEYTENFARIRFRGMGKNKHDLVFIDDVKVSGILLPSDISSSFDE